MILVSTDTIRILRSSIHSKIIEINDTFVSAPWIQELSAQKKTAYLQIVFQVLFIPFTDNVNSELLREINSKTMKILNLNKSDNNVRTSQPKSISHARSLSDPSLNMSCFVIDLFLLWFLYSQYNSLTQNALYKLCNQFNISKSYIFISENIVTSFIFYHYHRNIRKKKSRSFKVLKQTIKWGLIGGVTVLGGVSIVSTGGIAIPAVAAITGVVTGIFGGAAGSGFNEVLKFRKEDVLFKLFKDLFPMYAIKKKGNEEVLSPKNDFPLIESQIEGLDFFQHYICVSGFVPDDLSYPSIWGCHSWFNNLFPNINQILIKWESPLLSSLCSNLDLLSDETVIFDGELKQLKPVVLDMLKSKLLIDNIYINSRSKFNQLWTEMTNTTKNLGKELGDKLIHNFYGKRVISLFGYSFGGLVIINCLLYLYNLGKIGRGIISNVVLLGTPFEISTDIMSNLSVLISGKIYNGYSSNDWVLAYACRDSYGKGKIMGLQEVNYNDIVNLDLSELIIDHTDYKDKLKSIFRHLSSNMK